MTEKAFIERIRTERYKVGDDSSDELKGVLNRTLVKLADELYAKESHFVLELLQNADDNKYEIGCTPHIQFEVDNQTLVVSNNELGFKPENVDSLCDAGQSTKKSEKLQGYIGEKGIGFKSVFKISDAPQIHSNGFHFHFKTADEKDALGIVVPYWIDNPPEAYKGAGTTIVLPAKKGSKFDSKSFEDVQPELLLFLRRLKSVKIITKWDHQLREIIRKDNDNSITIECKQKSQNGVIEKTEHYRVAKYQANVSAIEAKERVGFKDTEIVMAFPVTDEGKPSYKDSKDVFAFLPVSNYGLNFVVQADFLLTSSRGEIQENNLWNSNLLEQIPMAFVQSGLPLFQSDENLMLGFYGYLKPERVAKLFEPVLTKIIELLKETDCVLSTDNYWMSPSSILISDNSCKELFNENELFELINKEFVSKEILTFRDILNELGCENFSIEHLIECLKDEEWVSGHKDNWDWFSKLFIYISGKVINDSIIQEIKKLKIFPLKNGEISTANENVFFPLNFDSYGFEECLSILDVRVLPKTDSPNRGRVLNFLEKVGISKAESKFIIEKHILVTHQNAKNSVNKDHFIGHIRYIKDHLEDYLEYFDPTLTEQNNAKKNLGSKLYILNSDENTFHIAEKVYIGKNYNNSNELEKLFADISSINFISSTYLKNKTDFAEMQSWSEFFRTIMANQLPKVVKIKPNASKLKITKPTTIAIDGVDFAPSEELGLLFESDDRAKKNQLLKLISKNWNNYFNLFTHADVVGLY